MGEVIKTLAQLEQDVAEATAALIAAQKAESIASQERCNAINRAPCA